MLSPLGTETLRQLQQLDSPTVSNAIEQFRVRTRNEGFVNGSVHCVFPHLPPTVGYAVTARVRTTSTPMSGKCYHDRMEWWSYVQSVPEPRFIVLQDIDTIPGLGALVDEVQACICVAFNSVAILTNGAIRDLPGLKHSGLQLFTHTLAVSHAYAHIVDFGSPVEVGGLLIKSGDLLHGDQHGVLCVPTEIAARIPRAASELRAAEADLIAFCKSSDFSFETLSAKLHQLSTSTGAPGGESHS